MHKFRFEDLEIWQMAVELCNSLFAVADLLEQKKLYRFVEQLRGSGLSVSNNIAEGLGSDSAREFRHFLNIARRSVFENANILIILDRKKIIDEKEVDSLLERLDVLARKITAFQRSLERRR